MAKITKHTETRGNPQLHVREQPLAHEPAAPTERHGPSQNSPTPIPDMRISPRARIALIGQPLLPKLLQGVEARRMKKR